jgi:hypothetical protein
MNKVTYDGVGDTLSILLSKKQIAYAEEHGQSLLTLTRRANRWSLRF